MDAAGFNHKNSILLKRAKVSELVPSSKTPAAPTVTVERDSENNRFFPINGGKRVAEGNCQNTTGFTDTLMRTHK